MSVCRMYVWFRWIYSIFDCEIGDFVCLSIFMTLYETSRFDYSEPLFPRSFNCISSSLLGNYRFLSLLLFYSFRLSLVSFGATLPFLSIYKQFVDLALEPFLKESILLHLLNDCYSCIDIFIFYFQLFYFTFTFIHFLSIFSLKNIVCV